MALAYLKPLETISARQGRCSSVFADFVRMAACCLAPRRMVDGCSVSVREDEYMEAIRSYDTRELELLKEAFHTFIAEAERHPHTDILGTAWLDLTSQSSKQARGEFYTPPCVARLMAQLGAGHEEVIASGQPVRIQEPACGAGTMILAAAELYAPDHWHLPRFTAIDLNPVACDMTFINTTIWSVPCEVICGNALFLKPTDKRYINLHWVRVGEEEIRAFHRFRRMLEPAPESVQLAPPRTADPQPFFVQPDLFDAA